RERTSGQASSTQRFQSEPVNTTQNDDWACDGPPTSRQNHFSDSIGHVRPSRLHYTTTGVSQIADNLLRRISRQSRAKRVHRGRLRSSPPSTVLRTQPNNPHIFSEYDSGTISSERMRASTHRDWEALHAHPIPTTGHSASPQGPCEGPTGLASHVVSATKQHR